MKNEAGDKSPNEAALSVLIEGEALTLVPLRSNYVGEGLCVLPKFLSPVINGGVSVSSRPTSLKAQFNIKSVGCDDLGAPIAEKKEE